MLELYGYEVDVVCAGEQGVEKARGWHPDVVLMDLHTPGRIDGLGAIRQLHSDPKTADATVIVVSALGGSIYKEQALEAGADAHFTKPVAIGELVAGINGRPGWM
jgi:CheY-like chemotaxis protein